MVIVMPMAGRGSRFAGSGYQRPKPLIEVKGKPMFVWATNSLQGIDYEQLVLISLQEHEENYGVKNLVKKYLGEKVEMVLLPDITEGQLVTVLAAKPFINKNTDVLVVSSDTVVVSDLGNDIRNKNPDCQGLISVANMPGNRWSFARTDDKGKVLEVTEKIRISDHASTGLYYFANGKQLVSIAETMIAEQEKTRGEYYVIPVYQKLIENGGLVGISVASAMWDLGTPEALQLFLDKN
jgi:UDP-N-acetylglucosamine diphosphorylase / glucose-1-phosphate thymidylyltransferase / UDP-N-acetylgalactosamine diphosphorylase / glucosamine-1-phosphate N-acetyltransferase / galactosamine-1-phosphate N-acetyltransferase